MKKLFWMLAVVFFNINSQQPFEFKSYKDGNGFLKATFLEELSGIFHPHVFFETGTYMGQTTAHAVPFFKEIHTVELHDGQFEQAQAKLACYNNVFVYHGTSPDVIGEVVPTLDGTILFWLDAHYSGSGTALSFEDTKDPKAFTAIREELQAIKQLNKKNCIILIDDIRGFGTRIRDQEYVASWEYPILQDVVDDLLEINPRYAFALVGDILFAYDQDLYHPLFSETVTACTKIRLYDGYNLSDYELLAIEKTIIHAPAHEKEFIKSLPSFMIGGKGYFFWDDLLCGLADFGSGNYTQAGIAFSKIKEMTQGTSNLLNYSHRRIDAYLQACNLLK